MTTTPQVASIQTPAVTKVAVAAQDDGGATGGSQNGREARNLAEKHRRDKLNASIQELSTMVPHVAESTRRLDKTAVLRFAAHGLRLRHVFGKSAQKKRQQQLMPQLTDTLLQLLDSFFVTLTCHGQIVVISTSVEKLLGHCQSDLYGQNILQLTHPDDQALFRQQLIPRDMESLFHTEYQQDECNELEDDEEEEINDSDDEPLHTTGYYHSQSQRTQAHLASIDKRLRSDQRCFTVRLARASNRSEAVRSYEFVKIDGCFRRSDCSATAGTFPIVSQLIRRSRSNGATGAFGGANVHQHDVIAQAALHGISGNDIVLVAMARIIRPPKIVNYLLDANQLEYRTRHLIDGRIIDCDQRIGLVAGYMKEEVQNLSPFSFMHQDDVRWVIVALRQMYDCNSDYGESYFRLLSRNGNFIYLRSKGYLEVDRDTNKVHSFICVNTLLDEQEGRRRVQEMKDKFSIIIKTKIPSNSLLNVPASQNPQQLERIVLYLIENLQKRHDNEEGTLTGTDALAISSSSPSSSCSSAQDDGARNVKTPLALVPPEPASVRNSISKSVIVVNVTAAKSLHQSISSPASQLSSSDISLSPTISPRGDEPFESSSPNDTSATTQSSQRPSVLKMSTISPMAPQSAAKRKVPAQQLTGRRSSLTNITETTITATNRGTSPPPLAPPPLQATVPMSPSPPPSSYSPSSVHSNSTSPLPAIQVIATQQQQQQQQQHQQQQHNNQQQQRQRQRQQQYQIQQQQQQVSVLKRLYATPASGIRLEGTTPPAKRNAITVIARSHTRQEQEQAQVQPLSHPQRIPQADLQSLQQQQCNRFPLPVQEANGPLRKIHASMQTECQPQRQRQPQPRLQAQSQQQPKQILLQHLQQQQQQKQTQQIATTTTTTATTMAANTATGALQSLPIPLPLPPQTSIVFEAELPNSTTITFHRRPV